MKLYKEYPATHSMSTSWFIADANGNVAIINYEDNGPLPWGTPSDTAIDDIAFGTYENWKERKFARIELSNNQVISFLNEPKKPDDITYWSDVVVEINKSQEEDYLKMAMLDNFEKNLCISPSLGLYRIDARNSTYEENHNYYPKSDSMLKKMIDEGIIKKVFRVKWFGFFEEDDFDNEEAFRKQYDDLPYYIFNEDYDVNCPQQRIHVPANPVKLNQVEPSLRERIPILPVIFNECEKLQVAEWVPCHVYWNKSKIAFGYSYYLLPKTDGEMAYMKEALAGFDMFSNCSERNRYGCTDCNEKCVRFGGLTNTPHPTIIIIFHPYHNWVHNFHAIEQKIQNNSVITPLMVKVPFPFSKHCPSGDDLKQALSEDGFRDLFMTNSYSLEQLITRFKPHVLLADKWSLPILFDKYGKDKHTLVIEHEAYPLFSMEELDTMNDYIITLAGKPYRGESAPQVISVEEMKNLHPND